MVTKKEPQLSNYSYQGRKVASKSIRTILPILSICVALSFHSCKDDDDFNEIVNSTTTELLESDDNAPIIENSLNASMGIIVADNSQISTSILSRCDNIVDPSNAEFAVVGGSQFESNSEAIKKAYNNGASIVVTNPNLSAISEWSKSNNINFVADESSSLLVYAFNNKGAVYSMEDCPAEADNAEYYKILTNSFVLWANNQSNNQMPISRSSNPSSINIEDICNSQSITHTYSIGIVDGELAHVALSKPDKLTKYSTIDVSYNIYPMHAFSTHQSSGDYYIVEGSVTAHNGNMYKGQWTSMHGGVHARLCGFYMSNLQVNTTLKGAKEVYFPAGQTPMPGTTIGQTSYTKGFDWGIKGDVTAGCRADGPYGQISVGVNLNWSNSESRTLSDINIELNTTNSSTETNPSVNYNFGIQNLPTSAGPANKKPDIPAVSRNDMTMDFSWVWYVPTANDYSEDQYSLEIYVNPTYKGYHWYSSAADFKRYTFSALDESRRTFSCKLAVPYRTPTGLLTLTNSSTSHQYIDGIKIWKESNNSNKPDFTISKTIASSAKASSTSSTEASIILPVGNYRVECVRYNISTAGERIEEQKVINENLSIEIGDTPVLDGGSGDFSVKK